VRAVGNEHSCDHVDAMQVLAAIAPNDVSSYLNMKTFGTTDPAGDAKPSFGMSKLVGNGQEKQLRISIRIAIHGVC
jgi:hypothetical protein